MCTINENHMMYGSWQTKFFVILNHFLPFYTLTTQKIKLLKKWKKHLEIASFCRSIPEIMICYTATWETTCDGMDGFWAIFCPFTLLMTKKVKHILFSSAHIVDFPHIFWTFLKGKISDYSDQNQDSHGSYLDGKKKNWQVVFNWIFRRRHSGYSRYSKKSIARHRQHIHLT